ncbi:MAG: GNAT family N-acetyltransferase [Clostridia bacterium]|nr:GNAT family N-acetyltransferase [Clostridia bacterium]
MDVLLKRAEEQDAPLLWSMQKRAFAPLLEKYGDVSTNPASEPLIKVIGRLRQSYADYYIIYIDGQAVGGVRVVRRRERKCNISPLFVVPEFQRRGIATAVLTILEEMYPETIWELNTILQETGNCRLYEKHGYRRTGEYEQINERMTLVYYRKTIRR